MVNPVLGKTNAHQVRWKDIPEVIAPVRTETKEIQKNHNDVAQRNKALARAMALNMEGRRDGSFGKYVMLGDGEIDEKASDIDSNASAVNDGGPTCLQISHCNMKAYEKIHARHKSLRVYVFLRSKYTQLKYKELTRKFVWINWAVHMVVAMK